MKSEKSSKKISAASLLIQTTLDGHLWFGHIQTINPYQSAATLVAADFRTRRVYVTAEQHLRTL